MQLYLQINHLLLPPFQFNGKKAPNIKILISFRVFPEVVGGRVVEVSAHHIFFIIPLNLVTNIARRNVMLITLDGLETEVFYL